LYKISDIKKRLDELGLQCSIDQIRKLEKLGLTFAVRNSKNNYREYTEEGLNKSLRNIVLYMFNTPIKDIKSDDPEVIKNSIKKIFKIIRKLT